MVAGGASIASARRSERCTRKDAQGAIASASAAPPVPVETQGDIGVYLTGLGAVTPVYTVTVHTRVDAS